jgi:hypothetical protein
VLYSCTHVCCVAPVLLCWTMTMLLLAIMSLLGHY